MSAGRIRQDGNSVPDWCTGNVVGHLDVRGNVPQIDAAVALMMVMGRTISGEGGSVDMVAFLADPLPL
jgi:hypothetical protein